MLTDRNRAIIKAHQQDLPVRVVALAEALGASVYTADWDTDTSGMIKRSRKEGGKRGYAIYVNKSHHPNRQRFTIAHEIAHIVLHAHLIKNGITSDALYRSGLPSTVEWEANRLAGNILMPWDWINQLMDEGVTSVESLAREFRVSKEAMAIQLDFPQIKEWSTPPVV